MRRVFGGDAATGVAHAQADELAGLGLGGTPLRGGAVQFNHGQGDGQFASFGHGIARIHGQVHENLSDHVLVGPDERRFGREIALQQNILSDDALKHFGQIAGDLVQIEHDGFNDLLAAEGEQLTGEIARAVGGLNDLFQIIERFLIEVPGWPGFARNLE